MLIGSPARASMIALLFDGRSLTASELGQAAGVAPATASNHLNRLVAAGLLACERHGRHRFYRFSNSRVAEAIEPLFNLIEPGSLWDTSGQKPPIREARLCYDHLAGRLGVMLTEAMIEQGMLAVRDRDFELTVRGEVFCTSLELDLMEIKSKRRLFARQCVDWSERRPHLSGSLGAALAELAFKRGWIRRSKDRRVIRVTGEGRKAFLELLQVRF